MSSHDSRSRSSSPCLPETARSSSVNGYMDGRSGPLILPLENSKAGSSPPGISKVICIGAGHVGGPTGAIIALQNPKLDVTVVDRDARRIRAWNSAWLPIHEIGLDDIVRCCRHRPCLDEVSRITTENPPVYLPGSDEDDRRKNLFFTMDIEAAIHEADIIFICVDTPAQPQDRCGPSATQLDLRTFEKAVRDIAKFSTNDKIVVEKSTVPCRTAERVKEILQQDCQPGVRFHVLSIPEFLTGGTAVQNLLCPDRVVIGSFDTAEDSEAAEKLVYLYSNWVPRAQIVRVSVRSAELSKLAANALLAQKITTINALSLICQRTGADISEVANVCGLDRRIGPFMLQASPGFGGGCLPKDLSCLASLSDQLDLPDVAEYWKSIVDTNQQHKRHFAERIISCLARALDCPGQIAVLGSTYKKDTSHYSGSAAVDIMLYLAAEGHQITVYDPAMSEEPFRDAVNKRASHLYPERTRSLAERVAVGQTTYQVCRYAHAIVILTEWEEYGNRNDENVERPEAASPSSSPIATSCSTKRNAGSDQTAPGGVPKTRQELSSNQGPRYHWQHMKRKPLDWGFIEENMMPPKLVFDGHNIVDPIKLERLGFKVVTIGKQSVHDVPECKIATA